MQLNVSSRNNYMLNSMHRGIFSRSIYISKQISLTETTMQHAAPPAKPLSVKSPAIVAVSPWHHTHLALSHHKP